MQFLYKRAKFFYLIFLKFYMAEILL